jgi:hypothetical protein
MEPISKNEVVKLLNWRPLDVKPRGWVRVTKGRYTGDPAFVTRREFGTGLRRLVVLLAPRLNLPSPESLPPSWEEVLSWVAEGSTPTKGWFGCGGGEPPISLGTKRKLSLDRPNQRLFDVKEFIKGEEEYNSVHEEDMDGVPTIYFSGKQYQHGLLLTTVPYNSVSSIDVEMDDISRRLFKATRHPALRSVSLPAPKDWLFFVNEKVEAVQSEVLEGVEGEVPQERRLRKGVIMQVETNSCWVHFMDQNDFDLDGNVVRIPFLNILKRFYVGDSVVVEAGERKGRYGMVLTCFDDELVVYDTSTKEVSYISAISLNMGLHFLGILCTSKCVQTVASPK